MSLYNVQCTPFFSAFEQLKRRSKWKRKTRDKNNFYTLCCSLSCRNMHLFIAKKIYLFKSLALTLIHIVIYVETHGGHQINKEKHRHILRHKQYRINTLDAIVTFMDIMEFKIKDLRYRKKSYVHICCTNVDNLQNSEGCTSWKQRSHEMYLLTSVVVRTCPNYQ